MKNRILITGTGRTGTSFIMAILTALDYDTGFDKNGIKGYLNNIAKYGFEGGRDRGHYIFKYPLCNLDYLDRHDVDHVIIPIRKLEHSALSRKRMADMGTKLGGFWNASNYEGQLKFNAEYLGRLISKTVEYDIPFTFIKFPKFIDDDGDYLLNKLNFAFPDIYQKEEIFKKTFKEIASPKLVNFR